MEKLTGERLAWRIVEICRDSGRFKTLFHGVGSTRSRVLPRGRWLEAEPRLVSNPGKGGRGFESGFHVLASRAACEAYLERFTAPRELAVVPVLVGGRVREKPGSRGVLLADRQKVL